MVIFYRTIVWGNFLFFRELFPFLKKLGPKRGLKDTNSTRGIPKYPLIIRNYL